MFSTRFNEMILLVISQSNRVERKEEVKSFNSVSNMKYAIYAYIRQAAVRKERSLDDHSWLVRKNQLKC